MTTIKIFKKQNSIIGFECSGHTGYAENGKDIVCAAVSSLSLTCALALEEIAKLKTITRRDDKKGWLKIMIDGETNPQSQTILQTFLLGIAQIQENYSKYIKLEEDNVF